MFVFSDGFCGFLRFVILSSFPQLVSSQPIYTCSLLHLSQLQLLLSSALVHITLHALRGAFYVLNAMLGALCAFEAPVRFWSHNRLLFWFIKVLVQLLAFSLCFCVRPHSAHNKLINEADGEKN